MYWLEIMHDPWYSIIMGLLCILLTLVVVAINNHDAQKARTLSTVVFISTLGWWGIKQLFIAPDSMGVGSFKTTVMTFNLAIFMIIAFWLGYVLLLYLKRGPRRVFLEAASDLMRKSSLKLAEMAKQDQKKPYTKEQYRDMMNDLVVVADQIVANRISTNLAVQPSTESLSAASPEIPGG